MKRFAWLKAALSLFKPTKKGNSNLQETLAMVYGGDIYTVLVRDRAARRLARTESHRDHRRDPAWPFIR